MRTRARSRLTNAAKRYSMTLASVMIRIPYKNRIIECSTAAEAIEILKHIEAEESKKIVRKTGGVNLNPFAALLQESIVESSWTRESFWKFIESLGEPQKRILELLVKNHKVGDDHLRKALRLDGNQALAGVLSGISKQAGSLNIPARSVYTVEDERIAGQVKKTYVAALDFMRIANEMNWPEE